MQEHYFDSKYRSSQATIGLSSLPQNSSVLGYNGGPVQSYANFARYSLGHNMPHNQFTEINSSALGVEAMNMESASTREVCNSALLFHVRSKARINHHVLNFLSDPKKKNTIIMLVPSALYYFCLGRLINYTICRVEYLR